ncbi:hypothetical protein [Microbacterium aurantiacum]|uniref:hypothetical protein n=1 Tax=Microbacterium aurantiacum TaxID=162393 RepID=UPI000C7F82E3|nr:hypothetical protein [Microbacterium aurantiacum]
MKKAVVALAAMGAVVRIEFGADVADEVIERARRAWSGAAIVPAPEALDSDLRIEVDQIPDIERFLERLSTDVTLEALAHGRGNLMMLHAAGVALDDGRVIAFVGPSGRGKTTLSRVLASVHGYVSDETIAFDRDLRVLPYRKPLSVVRKGAPKDQVAPADAGMRDLPDTELTLAAIVLLDRDPSVVEPEIEHLHFIDAVPLLVEQTSYLAELDGTVAALAELCERAGGVRRLRYSEAADVPAVIQSLLAAEPAPEPWERTRVAVKDAEGQSSWADAVDYGDTLVVLSDRTLRVLTGIAPTVLRAARESDDLGSIVNAVIEHHGTPPSGDPEEMVVTAIQELVEAGLIRRP